jgi:hypothetical protein
MKHSQLWLLALLSVLTLMTATSVMASEDGARVSGSWELGMSGINTDDNAARVNEYGSVRADDGISLAPKLDLEFKNGGFLLEAKSETMGPRDQKHELSIDAGRVFKYEGELNVLEHHKDHDTLGHLGATMQGDIAGNQPRVFTDRTENPEIYEQELDNDYIVTRREWKNEAELVIPQLANVTFRAGIRVETREGMEQAVGMDKCGSCHVVADGKEIDERTEDVTLGATGKFGLLTVDYEYLNRNFNEDGATPMRAYDASSGTHGNDGYADTSILLYGGSGDDPLRPYGETPDSEKESHMLKARLDLPKSTSVTASYVKADIESSKDGEDGVYELVGDDKLESEYEGFAAKFASTINRTLHLSLRGNVYEIDGPDYYVDFPARDEGTVTAKDISAGDGDIDSYVNPQHYESAESREVTELSLDGRYRLARYTTLRFGYDYEDIERDAEDHYNSTETHTYKLGLNTRVNRDLSARINYEFQDIDEPFAGSHVGIAQNHPDAITDPAYPGMAWLITDKYLGTDGNIGDVMYWNSVYPARGLESTNRPDAVHKVDFNSTWSPSSNMAATIFARVRYQDNDSVKYEQTTYSPGVSFWYAPTQKLNLTMFYAFNRQETENQMCVGWYHG